MIINLEEYLDDKKISKTFEQQLSDIVSWWMEDYSFEELLEEFDITPEEAFIQLFKTGYISEDEIERFLINE